MPHADRPDYSAPAGADIAMPDAAAAVAAPPRVTLTTRFPVLGRLPTPRLEPLVEGTTPLGLARNFLDKRLMNIQRRFVRHENEFGQEADSGYDEDERGYKDFAELCVDVDRVVNFLWYIGTPHIQAPYLFDLVTEFAHYATAMDPAPVPTFIVLRKMDHILASLVEQREIVTGEPLAEIDQFSISQTMRMRLSGIISTVRSTISDKMRGPAGLDDDDDEEQEEEEDSDDDDLGPSFDHHSDKEDDDIDDFPDDKPLEGVNNADADINVDGTRWRPPTTVLELQSAIASVFQQTLEALGEEDIEQEL